MLAQSTETAQARADRGIAITGRMTLAILALWGGVNAYAVDRYRCFPTDGSPTYTTPGTCRGDVIRREPLSHQEIAEAREIETRGRGFTRCTAADGRYSIFVSSEQACPSPTDTRTVEYAKKSIEQQKNDAEIVARAAASVGSLPQVASGATATPTASAKVAPLPTPAPAPASSVVPPSKPTVASPISWLMSALGWLVLVMAVLWAVISWRSRIAADTRVAKHRPERHPNQQTTAAKQSDKSATADQGTEMGMQAETLLALLEQPNGAVSIAGGLAFLDELKQAKLDYSLESVARVDQLLAKIKPQLVPQRSNWYEQPDAENFFRVLAFYLGSVISRQSNQPIRWYSREQAAPMMPPDMQLPDTRWARLVGVIAASSCVPLGVIEDALFGSEPPDMTCKAYVDRFIGRLGQALTPGMDENKRCAIMLEVFFSDAPMFGGLAFGEQLRQAKLDYSLDSLQRMDRLLRNLQPEIKLPYVEFINQMESQNFMRFVAFYIGMTVARLGALSVKWLDFEQAKKVIPELEFQFETSSVCLLSGRVYFPLGLVTEILLQPNAERNLVEWAKQALLAAPPPMQSILRNSLHANAVDEPFDAVLKRAIDRAGFMAAWAMFMVEGGSIGAPTVFVPAEGEGGTFRDFNFYGDGELAIQAAQRLMQINPDGIPYQVMSFDGYANLYTGRTDALTIELRVYALNSATEKVSFKLTVVCPYRNASDPKGFAIFSPKVSESSVPDSMHDAISKLFYQGIASYKSNTFDWFKYLDERI